MKNLTRIGLSLLGTWSAEVQLSDHGHDVLTAYFMVHFMADPRKGHGCSLGACSEVDNQVCLIEADEGTNIKETCKDISEEKDVSWSDVNAFFNFGVKVNSKSQPKARFELSTGDWIGPLSIVMAQEPIDDDINSTLIDRYVARYVQSQSLMPAFLQNRPPKAITLYNKPDDYAAFLGNPALKYMTKTQTNYTVNDTTTNDPYAPYLQTCNNGDLKPILPLIELEFFNESSTAFKMNYKIVAVPTKDEQAYRVLPQLQSKFQGQGEFNIMAGPYCYGNDSLRGHSFDLQLDSTHNGTGVSFVRGCLDGYPCVPPAAMGGLPRVSNDNHTCPSPPHVDPNKDMGVSNVLYLFLSYTLAVALLISITFHCKKDTPKKKPCARFSDEEEMTFRMMENNFEKPSFFGLSDKKADHQSEAINPFGDLDPEEETKVDPLQEPLLASKEPDEKEEEKAE